MADTIEVVGTYRAPDGTACAGWVAISIAEPRAVNTSAPEFRTDKRLSDRLDDAGSVSFTVVDSYDDGWTNPPVLYRIEEHLISDEDDHEWYGYLTATDDGSPRNLATVEQVSFP